MVGWKYWQFSANISLYVGNSTRQAHGIMEYQQEVTGTEESSLIRRVNISAKATGVLNFVRRNIYHCRPEVKALAYTSLIRPHLEYASAAWDTYTARDSYQLDKVQHRAAWLLKRDYRQTTSVSELISELRWQSLEDRWKNARLSLLYKGLHGLAAIPVN